MFHAPQCLLKTALYVQISMVAAYPESLWCHLSYTYRAQDSLVPTCCLTTLMS